MKLVTAQDMKEIERRAEEDEKFPVPTRELMLNAGQSVFEAIMVQSRFEVSADTDSELEEGTAVILAGSGNNGGDAMVTAALLRQQFPQADIKIYFYHRPRPDDEGGFPDKLTYTDAEEQDGMELDGEPAFEALESDLEEAVLVVDGLLGSGLKRPVTGALERIIDMVNEAHDERQHDPAPMMVVAIDVPSGINSDDGQPQGVAIKADLTVTLGYPKRGLYTYEAADYTGRITIGDIGISPALATQIEREAEKNHDPCIITSTWARAHLPSRPLTGHKGTFGKLMVLSGASNYLGAPYLCTGAGMRAGAGLVTLAAPQHIVNIVATKLSENTFLVLPEPTGEKEAGEAASMVRQQLTEGKYQVLLMGPGLGNDEGKAALVRNVLSWGKEPDFKWPRMVVDADGLNLLARVPEWWKQVPANNILTPHPGELATLRNQSISEIEADRLKSALEAAKAFNQVVVLKGAYTVVAAPDGRVKINPAGNAAMATAGSGDVLAGITAGLLTQFVREKEADAFDVACLAVYLHSMAGELVRRELGDMGPLAGDFLQSIPEAVVALKNGDSLE
ncbi:MAG TPA: NAD(P)H-hydrate dehydratase [Chloroflexia bacterium]|nr:NAD(P)H-hydrate dehydratase [Chloroflexia bacterium]